MMCVPTVRNPYIISYIEKNAHRQADTSSNYTHFSISASGFSYLNISALSLVVYVGIPT